MTIVTHAANLFIATRLYLYKISILGGLISARTGYKKCPKCHKITPKIIEKTEIKGYLQFHFQGSYFWANFLFLKIAFPKNSNTLKYLLTRTMKWKVLPLHLFNDCKNSLEARISDWLLLEDERTEGIISLDTGAIKDSLQIRSLMLLSVSI